MNAISLRRAFGGCMHHLRHGQTNTWEVLLLRCAFNCRLHKLQYCWTICCQRAIKAVSYILYNITIVYRKSCVSKSCVAQSRTKPKNDPLVPKWWQTACENIFKKQRLHCILHALERHTGNTTDPTWGSILNICIAFRTHCNNVWVTKLTPWADQYSTFVLFFTRIGTAYG